MNIGHNNIYKPQQNSLFGLTKLVIGGVLIYNLSKGRIPYVNKSFKFDYIKIDTGKYYNKFCDKFLKK